MFAGFTVAAAAVAASAQTTNHVAWSKIEMGPWRLNPLHSQDAGSGGPVEIRGFLAIADADAVAGNNLVAVWYIKTAAGWENKSWLTTDPWEAIKSVKTGLAISDAEDERWEVPGSDDGLTDPEVPQSYANGVLAQDPLAALVAAAPNRDELVAALTAVGYQAADIPIEKEDDCPADTKLEYLAGEAALMIADGDITILTMSAAAMSCYVIQNAPRGPKPTRPPIPATVPAWSPPGTIPTAPAWTPGGWPGLPGPGWDCRTVPTMGGGTNCICSRRQEWGRYESTLCGIWPFRYACTKWHRIIETETCTDVGGGACPAGGPPDAQSNCTSTY